MMATICVFVMMIATIGVPSMMAAIIWRRCIVPGDYEDMCVVALCSRPPAYSSTVYERLVH